MKPLIVQCRKRSRSTVYIERSREGHGQPDNSGKTDRRGGPHMGFPERMDTILDGIELSSI